MGHDAVRNTACGLFVNQRRRSCLPDWTAPMAVARSAMNCFTFLETLAARDWNHETYE